jgi:hypothetical protein
MESSTLSERSHSVEALWRLRARLLKQALSIMSVSCKGARRIPRLTQILSPPFPLHRPAQTGQIGTDPESSDATRDIVRPLLTNPLSCVILRRCSLAPC